MSTPSSGSLDSSVPLRGRSARRPRGLVLGLALLLVSGCGSDAPTQAVHFDNGILDMFIAQDWVLQRDAGEQAYYKHGVMSEVRLSFENQSENLGQPLTVPAVRSMIGKDLNRRYGGVDARFGYGGCAVLSYERLVDDGGGRVHTKNWVVAHPYGYGAVARVAITLTVPDGKQGTAEFQALVEALDRQVGDAKMPEA